MFLFYIKIETETEKNRFIIYYLLIDILSLRWHEGELDERKFELLEKSINFGHVPALPAPLQGLVVRQNLGQSRHFDNFKKSFTALN